MKVYMFSFAALMLLGGVAVQAQENPGKALKITDVQTSRAANNTLNVEFTADHNRLIIRKNEQMRVTPMVVTGKDTTNLAPIIFTGRARHLMTERNNFLYGYQKDQVQPYTEFVYTGKNRREVRKMTKEGTMSPAYEIDYSQAVGNQQGQGGTTIVVRKEYSWCGNYPQVSYETVATIQPVAPQISMVIPAIQTEKVRQESMTAHVNFEVGKSEIRRDLGNNMAELGRIDQFTGKIVGDENLNIRTVMLKGYASPEGSYASNDRLAANRVNSFRNYLQGLRVDGTKISVSHVAEDWDSVRSWVAASNIEFKSQILNIIDNTQNPDQRDQKIRALDNGRTYQMLLRDLYPQLRRVDYSVEYNIAPFTVEKGREVVKTHPDQLSLHEFYSVAESYPVNSPQYMDIYRQATVYYPNDPVAANNMAAAALKAGDLATAKTYLGRVADSPMSQNNLGVLNALEGNYDMAEQNFRKAISAGSKEAAFNLEHMQDLKLMK